MFTEFPVPSPLSAAGLLTKKRGEKNEPTENRNTQYGTADGRASVQRSGTPHHCQPSRALPRGSAAVLFKAVSCPDLWKVCALPCRAGTASKPVGGCAGGKSQPEDAGFDP